MSKTFNAKYLISEEDIRKKFRRQFELMDERYKDMHHKVDLYRAQITALLANDYEFTKLKNWERRPEIHNYRNFTKGILHSHTAKNKYVTG